MRLCGLLVWLVGEGLFKCWGEAMHGKCGWNTTRSHRRQEQGGWWCRRRRQKGIAPGHFFKSPIRSHLLCHTIHTHTFLLWPVFFLNLIQGNHCTVKEKSDSFGSPGSVWMKASGKKIFQYLPGFKYNTCKCNQHLVNVRQSMFGVYFCPARHNSYEISKLTKQKNWEL